jgi:hypothetical protein
VIAFEILFSIKSTSTDFIDCPILSIVNYNQYKGHDKPEIFKVEDFQVTRQIKALNSEIVKLNDSLNKKTTRGTGQVYSLLFYYFDVSG